MSQISHTATFSPVDPLPRILQDLACPACGHQGAEPPNWISDNTLGVFCDCCGAFVSIAVSDGQAGVIRGWSATLSTTGDPARRLERSRAVRLRSPG